MNGLGLSFLIITQFFAGRGLLYPFDIRLKPLPSFALSMICGIMLFSFLPLILAFAYIPITTQNVTLSIITTTILINAAQYRKYKLPSIKAIEQFIKSVPLYEFVFIIIFIGIMLPSIWHCYYWPPNARDILSGPEAIAEFAVREKTLINSVFTVDLESTNNHLKPPFVTNLQIIYKLLVQPFGQTWLSIFVLSFLLFFYNALKEKTHPLLAGILMLMFISAPELYAYTFIIMFDYCNMVLFFLSVYFLLQYRDSGNYKTLLFACVLGGFSTYIRLETIILLSMLLPMIGYMLYNAKAKPIKWVTATTLFVGLPYLIYYAWMGVFVKHYMPVKFDIGSQISLSYHGINPLTERFIKMHTDLLFGGLNLDLFGQIFNLFVIILLADALFFRKYPQQVVMILYALLVVYIGLPIIGYIIPWFDLSNTTKRGLFKLVPLALLYMAASGPFSKLSTLIYNWENGITRPGNKSTKVVPQQIKPKNQRKK